MAWLVLCRDVEDSKALRERYLQAHLAYIETVMDRVAVAGPLADVHGGRDLDGWGELGLERRHNGMSDFLR